MSGDRAAAERTECEAREHELDRVAWNLPRAPRAATSKTGPGKPKERGELRDATEAAEMARSRQQTQARAERGQTEGAGPAEKRPDSGTLARA